MRLDALLFSRRGDCADTRKLTFWHQKAQRRKSVAIVVIRERTGTEALAAQRGGCAIKKKMRRKM
jgi:hypothetical protein